MKLKDWIQKNNYTYRGFGKLIGKSENSVYSYVSGQRQPPLSTCSLIAEVTGNEVTMWDLREELRKIGRG